MIFCFELKLFKLAKSGWRKLNFGTSPLLQNIDKILEQIIGPRPFWFRIIDGHEEGKNHNRTLKWMWFSSIQAKVTNVNFFLLFEDFSCRLWFHSASLRRIKNEINIFHSNITAEKCGIKFMTICVSAVWLRVGRYGGDVSVNSLNGLTDLPPMNKFVPRHKSWPAFSDRIFDSFFLP